MSECQYTILTHGKISSGADFSQVRDRVKALCKCSDDTLDRIFSGKQFIFKQKLDQETARRYLQRLNQTGLVCVIEAQTCQTKYEPINRYEESFRCPKCGFEQQRGSSCEACGVVFEKFQKALHPNVNNFYAAPSVTTQSSSRSAGSGLFKILIAAMVIVVVGYFSFSLYGNPDRSEVVLYTTNNCEPCNMAKKLLVDKAVSFKEINIEDSDENMAKFDQYHVNTLPLAMIGGEKIVGFNSMAYEIAIEGFLGRQNGDLDQEIVMYSKPGCPGCKMAREYFSNKGIEFQEHDIYDPDYSSEYRSYAPLGTPLIFIGGIRVDGFSKPAIEMALRQVEDL